MTTVRDMAGSRPEIAVKHAIDPISVPRQKARLFARKLTIEWNGADRLVRWLYDHGLKIFFNRGVQLVSAALAVAGVVAFVLDARSHRFNLAGQSLAIGFVVLRKQAQPLLRYRTRDVSRVIPEPCGCGSPYPRIGRIVGRSERASRAGAAGTAGRSARPRA